MMKRFGRGFVSVLLVALILISSLTFSVAAAGDKQTYTFNLYPVLRENAKLYFTSTVNGYGSVALYSDSEITALTDEDEDENGFYPMDGYVKSHFAGTGDVIFGSTREAGMTIQNTSNRADIICNYIMEDGVFNYAKCYVVPNSYFADAITSTNPNTGAQNININNIQLDDPGNDIDVDECELCRIDPQAATIIIPKASTVILSFTTAKSQNREMYFTLMNFRAVRTNGRYTIGAYFGDEVDGVLSVSNHADEDYAEIYYDEEGEYSYVEFEATYADGMSFSYDNSADPDYTCIGLTDDDFNFYGIDSVFYPTKSTTLYPVLLSEDMPLYQVENMAFTDFQTALDEASNTLSKRVILIKSGILEAGDYTIPEDVTLLIPFDDAHTLYTDQPASVENAYISSRFCYRKLTMESGANITVEDGAAISLSAKHPSTLTNAGNHYNGAVAGGYGQIHMEEGSTITLNGSSNLYAWGYLTGEGFINANDGSTVYEYFQINDFRGGTITSRMADPVNLNQFPLNQYYVQNVEAHLRINYGAAEKVLLELYAGGKSIGFICSFIDTGETDECMFRLKTEGSYLEKYYNYKKDKSEYIMNGDADIDAITLSLSGVTISSADYYLPITNIDVTILSGSTLTTDKKIVFLPGSSVTVEEGAAITITTGEYTYVDSNGNDATKTCVGSVIFAAKEDVGKYSANGGTSVYPCKPVLYTPTAHPTRTWNDTPEVFLNNNGTITVEGDAALSATSEKAEIYSSTGNGTFVMEGSNATSVILTSYQSFDESAGSVVSDDVPIVPALIQDEVNDDDDSDAHSTGSTWGIPATFKKVNGKWGDFRNVTWLNNAGQVVHTEQDLAYDAFLTMEQPEHEEKPDDMYGSYFFLGWKIDTVTATEVTVIQDYRLVRPDCTVTWMVDDNVYATTIVPYLENATYEGVEEPYKAADAQYKFTFVGWTIDGETIYTYADALPVISDDTTFHAVFSTEDVVYTIYFNLYDIKGKSTVSEVTMRNVKYGTAFDNLYNELYSNLEGKPNLVERLKGLKNYTEDFSFVGWAATKNKTQSSNNAKNYVLAYAPDETIVIDGSQTRFTAAFVYTTGVFVNHSISLNGNIGVNYYIELPNGEDVAAYTVGYTFRGEYNEPVALADYLDTEYTGGVRYKFTVAADAPQMTDGVTAILYKNGKPVDSDMYKVADYSAEVFNNKVTTLVEGDYYLVGQINGEACWADAIKPEYRFTINSGDSDHEEYMLRWVEMKAGDEFKVVKYSADGCTYYPNIWDGNITPNKQVGADGVYTIYFRPNYDGSIGDPWYYQTINLTADRNLKALLRAMLNYGAKAQDFFSDQDYAESVNPDSAMNYIDRISEVNFPEVTDAQLEAAAPADSTVLSANAPVNTILAQYGLKYHGVSSVLDSQTALRLYFQITDEEQYNAIKNSITFGFNNEAAAPVIATPNGKYIYVEYKNIAIAKLGAGVTMKINGNQVIKYSVMDYLKKALDNEKTMLEPDAKLINLVTAMYYYNRLAVAYFD